MIAHVGNRMITLCPILGRATEVEPTPFSRGEWRIVRCKETRFVFLHNPPDYSRLSSELAWEVTSAAEKLRRKQTEPLISSLSVRAARLKLLLFPKRNRFFSLARTHLPKALQGEQLRFLDIGCGTGSLLVDLYNRFQAEHLNIVPHGIEVSLESAKLANETVKPLGGYVHQANALEGATQLEPGSIDVVIMSSFFEHESQPLLLLKRVKKALNDKGIVVLKVPNFGSINRVIRGSKWCGFRFPDHTNYFTPATLARVANEAGFHSHQTFFDKLISSDTMYAVLKKQ
ncbi:methyltransferase domain-containing protein [Planctomycetaceae bacterium SH139]